MNQPPPTEQPTGKRIVSKGEYAKAQGKRAVLVLVGTFVCVCGFGAASWLADYFGMPTLEHGAWVYKSDVDFVIATISVIAAMIVFGQASRLIFRGAMQIDPIVPLTRANTADLPAPDSLVRASEAPVQEPQAVLLRAAAEGQETPPEQMVRPAGGPELVCRATPT